MTNPTHTTAQRCHLALQAFLASYRSDVNAKLYMALATAECSHCGIAYGYAGERGGDCYQCGNVRSLWRKPAANQQFRLARPSRRAKKINHRRSEMEGQTVSLGDLIAAAERDRDRHLAFLMRLKEERMPPGRAPSPSPHASPQPGPQLVKDVA